VLLYSCIIYYIMYNNLWVRVCTVYLFILTKVFTVSPFVSVLCTAVNRCTTCTHLLTFRNVDRQADRRRENERERERESERETRVWQLAVYVYIILLRTNEGVWGADFLDLLSGRTRVLGDSNKI